MREACYCLIDDGRIIDNVISFSVTSARTRYRSTPVLIATAATSFPVTLDPKTLVSLSRRNVACNTGNSVWSHLRVYRRPISSEVGLASDSSPCIPEERERERERERGSFAFSHVSRKFTSGLIVRPTNPLMQLPRSLIESISLAESFSKLGLALLIHLDERFSRRGTLHNRRSISVSR